jgi:hypothetical protein|tara:strand:+ start:657 stop:1028 length:372 start_codon:yes stop_codon:yes gene_type:complete
MLHAPAAAKNKDPIGVALSHFGPFSQHDSGKTYKCLELGSGSGEHAAHLGKLFPYVVWQPTEYQGDVGPEWVPEEMRDEFSNFNSIKEHTKLLSNVICFFRPPTHFSHMSHPTFPISHLLFLL